MPKYQQFKERFDALLIVNGQYEKSKWITLEGKKLRAEIDLADFQEFSKLNEKIWALRFSTESRPKCVVCGNHTTLKGNKFNDTCGAKCAKLNPATAEKTRLTMQERYGTDFPSQSKEVRAKIEQACMDKFGVRVSSMAPEVIAKNKATHLERYGVTSAFSVPATREKALIGAASPESCQKRIDTLNKTFEAFGDKITASRKKTCLEKFGVEHPLQNAAVMKKVSATNLEKYGVEHIFSTGKIRERIADENLKRYEINDLPSRLDKILSAVNTELVGEKIWRGHLHVYKWKHLTCGKEFTSDLNDGKLPQCPNCKPRSKPQAKIKEILDSLNITYKENDRSKIKPYEIDFWLPEHDLGIEVNGVYWHHDGTSALPLLTKTNLVEAQGGQLLHFWDFEINEKLPIIRSIVKSKLGLLENKIYARKCEVVEIPFSEAREFLNKNHLCGYTTAKTHIGLVFENALVAVGTFSKNRFAKEDSNELVRFAILRNHHVVGGLSKVVTHFKRLDSKLLISFADRRISTGRAYKSAGFEDITKTSPNYFYQKNKDRVSRQKAMKHKLPLLLGEVFDINKTELVNMTENGWVKCSDVGNFKFSI